LRQALLQEAIIDPQGGLDFRGRPKLVWNAIAGWIFVGRPTNEPDLAYDCYPEVPATELVDELERRAERTVESFLANRNEDQP